MRLLGLVTASASAAALTAGTSSNPNYLNVDLIATKRFGAWELRPVGTVSDMTAVIANCAAPLLIAPTLDLATSEVLQHWRYLKGRIRVTLTSAFHPKRTLRAYPPRGLPRVSSGSKSPESS